MSIRVQPQLFTGMTETFSRVFTEGETALYAGLVGDNHLQSHSGGISVAEMSDRVTVHPAFLVGMISGLLNTRLPGEEARCITVKYEILAPVFCGDRVDTVIELIELDVVRHLATFRTDCYLPDKTQVIAGQAVMLVPVQLIS